MFQAFFSEWNERWKTEFVEVKQQKPDMEIDRNMPEYVIVEPHF